MAGTAATARIQIVKWGNSHAVRLPRHVLEAAALREGDELIVTTRAGHIGLAPAVPEIPLKKLVAGINRQNIHKEIAWGGPLGNEAW